MVYHDDLKKLDALRASIRPLGATRIARESDVSLRAIQTFINDGTTTLESMIAKIEAAVKRLGAERQRRAMEPTALGRRTWAVETVTGQGARQVRVPRFGRYALSIFAVAGILAGCGGSQPPIATSAVNGAGRSFSHHHTFLYTGKKQVFIVPALVTQIAVVARGPAGAGSTGGRGGRVFAIIPVTQGQKLYVYVGGAASGSSGGFNGGAHGGTLHYDIGSGGGGASDVRQGGDRLRDRVLVAGGGGGGGAGCGSNNAQERAYGEGGGGGKGGGSIGGIGQTGCPGGSYYGYGGAGGSGGTQYQGGAGGSGGSGALGTGNPGAPGSLQKGGAGGAGCQGGSSCYSGGSGGGGGGGCYGGGGGGVGGGGSGYSWGGGGGGGGSSYIEPSAKHARMWRGWYKALGNGLVVFSW